MTSENILIIENLVKRFGGLVAVNELSFYVKNGEILGFVGPNGAGKTTTFNLITGNLKLDKGRIMLDGEEITGLKPYQIAQKGIQRTFQLVKVFPEMKVFDHVMVGGIAKYGVSGDREKIRKETEEILDFLHISDKKDVLVKNLTIPMKKKVELATALIRKPKVLLLDELMAGLNPSEIDESLELLRKINQEMNITLIVVEHIMRAVMTISQRVIVLHYGKKIAEGPPKEIVNNPEVIKAYLGEGM